MPGGRPAVVGVEPIVLADTELLPRLFRAPADVRAAVAQEDELVAQLRQAKHWTWPPPGFRDRQREARFVDPDTLDLLLLTHHD